MTDGDPDPLSSLPSHSPYVHSVALKRVFEPR
jgi:hypothetical protein